MTLLPIVSRELRVAARRSSTYWIRTAAAAGILVVAAWLFIMVQSQGSRETALTIFGVTTAIAGFYALFSGVRATADCISYEKREGTLGLLFLTDLKGYDVVLGKLVSSSVSSFYGVLAILPILAVPLLMGGITFALFGKISLVVVNALFFSLCIGIWASSVSRQLRKSLSLTSLTILVITAGLPGLAAVLNAYSKWPALTEWLLLPSPGFAYWRAFWDSSGIRGAVAAPDPFWFSMAIIHGIGWLCLIMASLVVPRSWQDRAVGERHAGWRSFLMKSFLWSKDDAASYRRRLLGVNPFFWLAARARLKPALVWLMLGLLAAGWLWGLWEFEREWLNEGVYIITAVVLNLLLKGWFASESGRQLLEDRQQGTLELLLVTPLGIRQILQGQRLELQRQFLAPVALVLFLQCVFLVAGRSEFSGRNDANVWVLVWLASMLVLVGDLIALFWVGTWQCMISRSAQVASQRAASRILVLPWLLWAMILTLLYFGSNFGRNFEPSGEFLVGLYLFLSLLIDFAFGAYARLRLLNDFREMATRRFEAPRTFWKTLLGQ